MVLSKTINCSMAGGHPMYKHFVENFMKRGGDSFQVFHFRIFSIVRLNNLLLLIEGLHKYFVENFMKRGGDSFQVFDFRIFSIVRLNNLLLLIEGLQLLIQRDLINPTIFSIKRLELSIERLNQSDYCQYKDFILSNRET